MILLLLSLLLFYLTIWIFIFLGPDVFDVKDVQIPVTNPDGNITIRIYTPAGTGPFPVHVNTHGGMFFSMYKKSPSTS